MEERNPLPERPAGSVVSLPAHGGPHVLASITVQPAQLECLPGAGGVGLEASLGSAPELEVTLRGRLAGGLWFTVAFLSSPLLLPHPDPEQLWGEQPSKGSWELGGGRERQAWLTPPLGPSLRAHMLDRCRLPPSVFLDLSRVLATCRAAQMCWETVVPGAARN